MEMGCKAKFQAPILLIENRTASDDFVELATAPVNVFEVVDSEELVVADVCELVMAGHACADLDVNTLVVCSAPFVYVIKLGSRPVVVLAAASPCTKGMVTPGHFFAQSLYTV